MQLRIITLTALAALLAGSSSASAETISTHIGRFDMERSYPSDASINKLYDERDFQRATQAYIWVLFIARLRDAGRICGQTHRNRRWAAQP
jgi:hypothetical protein